MQAVIVLPKIGSDFHPIFMLSGFGDYAANALKNWKDLNVLKIPMINLYRLALNLFVVN